MPVTTRISYGRRKVTTNGVLLDSVNQMFDSLFASELEKQQELVNPMGAENDLQASMENLYATMINSNLNHFMGELSPSTGLSIKEDKAAIGALNRGIMTRSKFRSTPLGAKAISGKTQQLRWDGLMKTTIQYKSKTVTPQLARRFFVHTGSLKSELLKKTRDMIKRTGTVKMQWSPRDLKTKKFISRASQKTVNFAQIQVRLLPNVRSGLLPGLNSGDWTDDTGNVAFERSLGITGMALRKLDRAAYGQSLKRPLLQPIFTYVTLFSAPEMLLRKLGGYLGR